MLMSHLQDTISHADPMTQILYNRTMVQLGMQKFFFYDFYCLQFKDFS